MFNSGLDCNRRLHNGDKDWKMNRHKTDRNVSRLFSVFVLAFYFKCATSFSVLVRLRRPSRSAVLFPWTVVSISVSLHPHPANPPSIDFRNRLWRRLSGRSLLTERTTDYVTSKATQTGSESCEAIHRRKGTGETVWKAIGSQVGG